MKTDNIRQNTTKQDERFKEGKQKDRQYSNNNRQYIFKNQHKIVVNLLKSLKIDKEPIRINASKTDKSRKTQSGMNSTPNQQRYYKFANKLTEN